MILQAVVLNVLFCCVHSFPIEVVFKKDVKFSDYDIEVDDVRISTLLEKVKVNDDRAMEEEEDVSISTLLEKANVNVGKNLNEPLVMFGDIAVPTNLRNADPCTARGCLWPKGPDGNVYVPYRISNQFSRRERDFIIRSLDSFSQSTCIRFTPFDGQRDFVDIQSLSGCFSFVGRRGRAQTVSISRQGCVFQSTIQHEMLHALGFNHEQTRSDRDEHVRILLENVIPGMEHNFRKIQTRNLGTPYDYNSVMHYGRFAFSRNRQPTIVPIPDPNVAIGRATQMSPVDILRVNRLYQCNSTASRSFRMPVRRYQFV